MAKVTGILADFGLGYLVGLHPTIAFQPSGVAIGNTRIFAPQDVIVAPVSATGFFEVDLQPTDAISPAVTYKVSIRWGSGKHTVLPWRLRVPSGGGVLSDLLTYPVNPELVWVGAEPPPNPEPGRLWLNSETGILQEWSN